MADNYLGKKMEDFLSGKISTPKRVMNFAKLVAKNRSYRGYDNSFVVRADQLQRIMAVVPACPSARNQQVLRLRPVLADEAEKVLPHIRLGVRCANSNCHFRGQNLAPLSSSARQLRRISMLIWI